MYIHTSFKEGDHVRIELKNVASEIPCETDHTVHGHGSFFLICKK